MPRNEPRVTAFLSQDPNMLQAYREGKDLYAVIAQSVYDNKYEDNLEFYPEGTKLVIDGKETICGHKTHTNPEGKKRRASAKTLLLAILYGMSGRTVAQRIGKAPEEGQKILDTFFQRFPKVKQLLDQSKKDLGQNGYVEDVFGRRRHLPDYFLSDYEVSYKDEDKVEGNTFNPFLECQNRQFIDAKLKGWLVKAQATRGNDAFEALAKEALKDGVVLTANTGRKAKAERQCLNARVQGSAASITKLAMIDIDKDPEMNYYRAKTIIPVHDELLVECPAYYKDKVAERLPRVMVDSVKDYITNVPMACDPSVVKHWYADEAATNIVAEYKKLEETMSPEQAFGELKQEHTEFSEKCLRDVVYNGTNIEFEEDEG